MILPLPSTEDIPALPPLLAQEGCEEYKSDWEKGYQNYQGHSTARQLETGNSQFVLIRGIFPHPPAQLCTLSQGHTLREYK